MRLTLIIFLFASVNPFAQDQEEVKVCFDSFKIFFMNKEAQKALDFADNKSIEFLNRALNNTLNADSITISKLDSFEKQLVLCTRLLSPSEGIKKMNATALFQFYLDHNLYGTYEYIDVGETIIENTQAKAKLVSRGKEFDFYLYFVKEKNKWKYNINSPMDIEKIKLKMIIERENITEMEFILDRVRNITEKEITKATWKPIQ